MMSRQANVWKDAAASNTLDDSYPAQTTGDRYARYSSTNGVIKDSNTPRNAATSDTSAVANGPYKAAINGHASSEDSNGEYGRIALSQGLSFSSFVQQSRKDKSNGYDDQHSSPRHNDGSGALKEDEANMSLSSSGKWRSRRAEQLKANPHQKQPYSSNPVQPLSNHTSAGSNTAAPTTAAPGGAVLSGNVNEVAPSPTTYSNSRFTQFVNQEHPHSNASTTDDPHNAATPRMTWSEHANPSNGVSDNGMAPTLNPGPLTEDPSVQEQWYYKDPSGQEQGPFDREQMSQWFSDGYFPQNLPIRGNPDTPFVQLKDWFHQGMNAFLHEIPKQWPQTSEPVLINPMCRRQEHGQPQAQALDPYLPNGHDPGNIGAIAADSGAVGNALHSQQDPFPNTQSSQRVPHPSSSQQPPQSATDQTTNSNVAYGRYHDRSTPASSDQHHDDRHAINERHSNHNDDVQYDVNSSYTQHQTQPPPQSKTEEDENGTAKSSHADADSFYEPNSARMASIHPRPPQHDQGAVANANSAAPGNVNSAVNPDEAMNYWVASGSQEVGSGPVSPSGGGGKGPSYPSYERAGAAKAFYQDSPQKLSGNGNVNYYSFESEDTAPQDTGSGAKSKRDGGKLTEVAYDRSLAATPPQSNPSEYWQQAPPEPQQQSGNAVSNLFGDPNDGMYRTSSDPSAYHDHVHSGQDSSGAIREMGDLQRMRSDPGHDAKSKNVYDPFGAQDLFANGRRSLTQQLDAACNGGGVGNGREEAHSNKFTADSLTHTMQQGASHRKYPTRQPLKHSMSDGTHGTHGNRGHELLEGGNGSSLSSSSSTTPNKQRDRKPPIRHKWAHHDPNYSDQFKKMLGTGGLRQSPPLPPQHTEYDREGKALHNRYAVQQHQHQHPHPQHQLSQNTVHQTQHQHGHPAHPHHQHQHQPHPHHYSQYDHGSMNEATLSIPAQIDHVPSKLKSDAVTVSELFGGAGSNGPMPSNVDDGYHPADALGDGESSKKPKTRKRRKKKSVVKKGGAGSGNAASSSSSEVMLPDKMNVWGSQAASTTTSSRSFTELQAEDSQRMMQQKRRRAEEVRRKAEEAMIQKQQQKVSPQPPPTLSALLKDQQQPVNVWASGGALKSAKGKSATVKGAKSVKPKVAKPAKVAKAKKVKSVKGAKPKVAKQQQAKPKQAMNGSNSSWSNRASVAAHNGHGVTGQGATSAMNAKRTPQQSAKGKKGQSGNGQKVGAKGKGQGKAAKNGKNSKRGGGSNNHHAHFGQQNNRNIEAVNKVSAELQHWLRTEIKKLNPDVEAVSVAHLLLTLDDDTARTTAVHTFGNNSEVSTFIDSFLMHRSHDIQQQKHKGTSKVHVGGRGGHKKKKKNQSRR